MDTTKVNLRFTTITIFDGENQQAIVTTLPERLSVAECREHVKRNYSEGSLFIKKENVNKVVEVPTHKLIELIELLD